MALFASQTKRRRRTAASNGNGKKYNFAQDDE